MTRGKIEATVSLSYFDFDFGDEVQAADAFAKVARATLTEPRSIELNVKYLPIDEEEKEEQEDKEEEQDDQTTD